MATAWVGAWTAGTPPAGLDAARRRIGRRQLRGRHREVAARVLARVHQHALHVGLQVVVGEDGGRRVGLDIGVEQVLGRAGDRVGRVVDVRGPVAVLVGGHAGHHLAGRMDRCAAPGRCRTRLRCRSASARPRRSRSGHCARRAGWSGRCCSPPCRCRPGSSTARRTAARPSCTRTGSSTGCALALAPAGGCPAVPVCCPEQPAVAAKNAFVPTRMGTASRPRPTTARSPMMPTTRIRGARCSLVVPGLDSVRIRSLFVMTDPRWPARCCRPASWCPIRSP